MFKKPIRKNSNQGELLIEPPKKGKKISLNKIINSAPEGSLIKLAEGEYLIDKTIVISNPIRLSGEGIDKTTITGNGLALLLDSHGGYNIEIKDISFLTNSEKPTTAVEISGGEINITSCSFTGGIYSPDKISGNGVFVRGNAQVSIIDSLFFENQESGLRIGGDVQGIVKNCKFVRNDSGLAVTENAFIEVSNCDFTENHIGFAFDDSATGVINDNKIFKNRTGSLAKGSSIPKITNNEFVQNDISIGLAEKCDVLIKENVIFDSNRWGINLVHDATALIENNTIQDCKSGIGAIDQSNTKIYRNNILRNNSIGIVVRNDSTTHIAENMISDNQYGIEVNHDVSFLIETNHIIRNSKLGMYTRRQAKGTVQKNVIEKNGDGGFIILDDSTVDFDNYKEPVEPGKPVSYSGQHSQINVHAPKETNRVFFGDLIANIQPDSEIVLEDGEYVLSDPLFIEKPLKLIAKTIGNVKITGYDLPNLLVYESRGKLSLVGITFSMDSQNQSNVVMVKSGELEMDQCTVEGGKDLLVLKRDFGAGLILHGTSIAAVSNSLFTKNVLGISVQDQSSLTLISSKSSENGYGIVFRDDARSKSRDNEYFDNQAYGFMVYDNAEVSVQRDTCYNNSGGFGFLYNAKAVIEFSKAYKHEHHGFFINDWADVRVNGCKSYSNIFSGFAIFADSHSQFHDCESYDNSHHGFEFSENAKSALVNNKIWDNYYSGVTVADTAEVKIETNEIFKNATGIHIRDEAIATVENNKIYSHYEEAIDNESENESTIGDNELFENGEEYVGDEDDDSEDDDESLGFDLGNFFANMFGSENISDDPNTIAIPLGHLFSGNADEHDEEYDDDEEDEE